MPDNTPAETPAPTGAESTTEATNTPQTDVSSSASTSGDFEPSWFTALDNAFAAETSGTTEPKTDDAKPAEEKPEDSEKKPEDSTDDSADDETVKNMTASAGAKFKEIKAEAKAARTRVAELEAKLAEVESATKPDLAEAEKLQAAIAEKEAKLAEYEKEIAISRFEATEEYKESVVAPMAAIIGVIEDLAKEYEISEKSLLGILEEPNRKTQEKLIMELASNFSERDRITLYNLGDDYAAVMDQRDKLRSRASEALAVREKAKQAEEVRKAEEARKSWETSAKTVWDSFKTKIPLPESEADRGKFESEVVSQVAKLDFDKLSNDHKAFAAYAGAVIPEVVKANKALTSELAELKEALKKYQSATPGAGTGTETKPQEMDSSISFLDALEKRLAAS
jgi:hypothetical protein